MLIGNKSIDPPLALAPMAGVTDLAFRKVCRGRGAVLTCTEMVSAAGIYYGDGKTASYLEIGEDEHPSSVQIFGHDPEVMRYAAGHVCNRSRCDIIDVNMGCPTGKVVKNGDGSALMRDMDLAEKILRAVVSASDRPVTVKIRKGWDSGSVNAVDFAKMAERAGVSAVTVHGRTRVQLYSGRADWEIIRAVKSAVSIPVIANGDVFSAKDALRALKLTGADGVMIGRAAFGNPWVFEKAAAAMLGLPEPPDPTVRERMDTALGQLETMILYKGEKIACLEARKHFPWYLRSLPGAAHYRERFQKAVKREDFYRLAEEVCAKRG